MKIETRITDGVVVLDAHGRLVLGDDCQNLHSVVDNLVNSDMPNVLFNLGDVGMIDSSGLGAMLSCKQKTEAAEGTFKLLNLTVRHRELLVMTYLITHFEHFEDEAEAIKSFRLRVAQAIK
jgi:anti-sigma B factor antagonist